MAKGEVHVSLTPVCLVILPRKTIQKILLWAECFIVHRLFLSNIESSHQIRFFHLNINPRV